MADAEGAAPGAVVLLQPTSPFVRGADVDACLSMLWRSIRTPFRPRTVTSVIHNAHALNQRIIEEGRVRFRFVEERRAAYNKQRKPKHFLFGNLVVTRSRALLAGSDCFAEPSIPVEIPPSSRRSTWTPRRTSVSRITWSGRAWCSSIRYDRLRCSKSAFSFPATRAASGRCCLSPRCWRGPAGWSVTALGLPPTFAQVRDGLAGRPPCIGRGDRCGRPGRRRRRTCWTPRSPTHRPHVVVVGLKPGTGAAAGDAGTARDRSGPPSGRAVGRHPRLLGLLPRTLRRPGWADRPRP